MIKPRGRTGQTVPKAENKTKRTGPNREAAALAEEAVLRRAMRSRQKIAKFIQEHFYDRKKEGRPLSWPHEYSHYGVQIDWAIKAADFVTDRKMKSGAIGRRVKSIKRKISAKERTLENLAQTEALAVKKEIGKLENEYRKIMRKVLDDALKRVATDVRFYGAGRKSQVRLEPNRKYKMSGLPGDEIPGGRQLATKGLPRNWDKDGKAIEWQPGILQRAKYKELGAYREHLKKKAKYRIDPNDPLAEKKRQIARVTGKWVRAVNAFRLDQARGASALIELLLNDTVELTANGADLLGHLLRQNDWKQHRREQ
jgi:hypothetical protein